MLSPAIEKATLALPIVRQRWWCLPRSWCWRSREGIATGAAYSRCTPLPALNSTITYSVPTATLISDIGVGVGKKNKVSLTNLILTRNRTVCLFASYPCVCLYVCVFLSVKNNNWSGQRHMNHVRRLFFVFNIFISRGTLLITMQVHGTRDCSEAQVRLLFALKISILIPLCFM